jgi:iron complex transport system substrate-binding protein
MNSCGNLIRSLFYGLILQFLCVRSTIAEQSCQRIISLAPSITESLYEVGLGDRVVAVTNFCKYPEAAQKLPMLGAYFDSNLEAALLLKPDLVVGLPELSQTIEKYKELDISTLTLSNTSIHEINDSFLKLCDICGCEQRAQELVRNLTQRVETIHQSLELKPKLKVAVLVVSAIGPELKEFYLSGSDGYYSSLLDAVNASNVITSKTISLPMLSLESLAVLQPQIVFVIEGQKNSLSKLEIELKSYIPNVQLHYLQQDYASIPGPRFIYLLEDMKLIIQKYYADSHT